MNKFFSSARKKSGVWKMLFPAIGLSQTTGIGFDFHFQIIMWCWCGRNLLLESNLLGKVFPGEKVKRCWTLIAGRICFTFYKPDRKKQCTVTKKILTCWNFYFPLPYICHDVIWVRSQRGTHGGLMFQCIGLCYLTFALSAFLWPCRTGREVQAVGYFQLKVVCHFSLVF